jgi:hypothetical protein
LLAWLKERDIDEAEVLAAKLGKLGITVLTLVEGGVSQEFLEKVRTWRTHHSCTLTLALTRKLTLTSGPVLVLCAVQAAAPAHTDPANTEQGGVQSKEAV